MALDKQIVTLPLGALGMDAGIDPKVQQGLLRAENVSYDLRGVATKRAGSVKGLEYSDPVLAKFRDSPVVVGNSVISDVSDGSHFFGTAGLFDISTLSLSQSNRSAYYYCDVVQTSGVIAVAYTVKVGTNYIVRLDTFGVDTTNRTDTKQLLGATSVESFGRVVKLLSGALMYYYIDGSGVLTGGTISAVGVIGTPAAIAGAPTAATLTTMREFDCCVVESGDAAGSVIVSYIGSTGIDKLVTVSLPAGLGTGIATDTLSHAGAQLYHIGCWRQSSGVVTVGYTVQAAASAVDLNIKIYTYALVEVLASTKIDTVASGTTSLNVAGVATADGTGAAYWSVVVTASAVPTIRRALYTTAAAVSAARWLGRARLAAKPTRQAATSASAWVPVYARSWNYALGAQDTVFVLDSSANVWGKCLTGTARTGDAYGQLASTQAGTAATNFVFGCMGLVLLDNSADHKNVYQIYRLKMAAQAYPKCWDTPGHLLIPNSCPYDIDGADVCEHGFLMYPEPLGTLTKSSGGGMGAGVYLYKACYEWIDANGKRHQSAPTPEYSSITLTTETEVTIPCPTLTLTRRTNVQIAIFRTTAGAATPFYRVGTIANDTSVDSVSYVDVQPDSFIADMDQLYSETELECTSPRPYRVGCLFGARYFTVARDAEETDIYYSKEFSGPDPVQCSDQLLVKCDSLGGRICALVGFVDKLIVFKSSSIFAVEGLGYDNALGGTNFERPWHVNPGVGCSDDWLVAMTPIGIAFVGPDGRVWVLDHGMQCTAISEPVQHWMSTVTPVQLVADPANSVLHVMSDSYDLVYNWDQKRWAIWSARECVAAVEADGEVWWKDSGNYLWHSDSTVWLDDVTRYTMRLETGWLSVAQIGGVQRIYRILIVGGKLADHELRVQISYDLDPTWIDSALYDASALKSISAGDYFASAGLAATYEGQAYCLEVFPTRPCCSSIRIAVSDETGTGDTWSLAAISMLVGVKQGASMRRQKGSVL